ncbi:MAG: glycine cleavage system protein H [Candidatus Aramenus sulfurataquae]|jgi:glycine cleavage system H protein|uniref:Glycine cleavage system protein GcvH n=2 Tax=Candidatus Aramenus sulfurataquae TaxID=1326980 RepID=A0ACC6TNS3_9CREN|nr:MAG: glycine cleavage system protein H [Candidatus Aramenus sulfurataquae]MCL7344007.1 glycine cleavage system protein GcvH [Candidatus Aramenus sulfurataquae]
MKVGKYEVLEDRYYTESDEWVKIEGEIATVGITDYAQKKLRDIVGVELPQIGREVKMGESVAVVESVKAAADIYSPLSGTVVEANEDLLSEPELINKDPYGAGWIFKLKITNKAEVEKLLTTEKYSEKIRGD